MSFAARALPAIDPNCAAQHTGAGAVQAGMRVVTINDHLVFGLTTPEVVAIIQSSSGDDMYEVPTADYAGVQCKLELQSAAYTAKVEGADGNDEELNGFASVRELPPVWFHGELDKQTAGAVLQKETKGIFLVRQRMGKDEFALALTLGGGKVRHHRIHKSHRGMLSIDGVDIGDVNKLAALVDRLRLPQDNWPQQLLGFVARPGCALSEVRNELGHVARIHARADRILRIERWEIDQRGERIRVEEERLAREQQAEKDRVARQLAEEAERDQALVDFEQQRLAQVEVDRAQRSSLQRTRSTNLRRKSEDFTQRAEAKAAALLAKKVPKPRKPKADDVGRRCTIKGYTCRGTIRFFGKQDSKTKVGIELDYALGKHSGSTGGVEYFKCAQKHGVMVVPSKVKIVGDAADAADDVDWDAAQGRETTNRSSMYVEQGGAAGTIVEGDGGDDEDGDMYGALRGFSYEATQGSPPDTPGFEQDPTSPDPPKGPEVDLTPNVLYEGLDEPDYGDLLAMDETRAEPESLEPVTLRLPLGLGFDAIPGYGCYITKVKEGGNAAASGVINPDMRLMYVNGISVDGKTKRDVTGLFRAGGTTRIPLESDDMCVLTLANDPAGARQYAQVKESQLREDVELPLGLALDGNADDGFYVIGLRPGGNAAKTGTISVGMRFSIINQQAAIGLPKESMLAAIAGSANKRASLSSQSADDNVCSLEFVTDVAALTKWKQTQQEE